MPFEGLIGAFARMDSWSQAPFASNPETLRRYYALSVGTALSILGLIILAGVAWERLNERARNAIYGLTMTFACSCALMICMSGMEYEGPWLRIGVVMKTPSAVPIFGHRLLFVWIAKVFQEVLPNLSNFRSFYLSQCIATLLAVYALGKWSALHIGNSFSWLGQIMGVLLIATCFSYSYYNFYDIGTVFFTTCGLLAVYSRRYWWLVLIVIIGTLNYEGVLLLIPVAAFMAYDNESPRRWVPVIAISLLAYCAVRFAMQAAIPIPRHVDWRIWSNMSKPFVLRKEMAFSVFTIAGWYAVGFMSLRYCDPRVKRMTILFPLLFAVNFLFGQFNEPRLFDAFIPVLVAIILSASKRKVELEICPIPSAVR